MGNFEKLSVLVIVVIIVMILVVALYTWTDKPEDSASSDPDLQSERTDDQVNFESVPPMDPQEGGDGGWSPPPVFPDEDPTLASKGEALSEDKPIAPSPKPEPLADAPMEGSDDAGPWYYTIKNGDVLSVIAQRELGTIRRLKEIMALNPGINPVALQVGEKIKMPPKKMPAGMMSSTKVAAESGGAAPVSSPPSGGSSPRPGMHYVIQKGDVLTSISKRAYGTIERWPEIWASNLSVLPDPDMPVPGRKIWLPK